MWLSKKMTAPPPGEPAPLIGSVTLSGSMTAAHTDAEWRDIAVCGPGGYRWRPSLGANVLVIKDPNGGKPYALAELSKEKTPLGEGELLISTGQASLHMFPNGRIEMTGQVLVNGAKVMTE